MKKIFVLSVLLGVTVSASAQIEIRPDHPRIFFNADTWPAIKEKAYGENRAYLDKLLDEVENGLSLALVSDAGTPSVADPGFLLVRSALERGLEPIVVPGVSAVTFSVTASGLPVDSFTFRNFAPVKPGKKGKFLESILADTRTSFFFESPFRIGRTLKEIAAISPEAKVAVIREATKLHEEILRGTAAELAAVERQWKGEIVVGVYPAAE